MQKYLLFTLTCTFDTEDHVLLENYTQYSITVCMSDFHFHQSCILTRYLLLKCDFCVLFYNTATNEGKMF